MFRTDRIAISPLRTDDTGLLWSWINDRSQVLFNAPYKPVSEAAHRAWLDGLGTQSDRVVFGIRLLESDELVGTCHLLSISPVHRSAELQIRLGSPLRRGQGYGTEAVGLLLRFAFQDLNLNRVQLQVFASNVAAQRCYEKAGFVIEGRLRQAAHIDGHYVDLVTMGILREEFSPV